MTGKHEKTAFTLAEVLITLGIIGVVAAMTMPTLVQNYKKQVVETRLAKFYSTFNQAIKMSEIDNGNYDDWDFSAETEEEVVAWQNKYISPYLKILKSKPVLIDNKYRIVNWLPDGSLLALSNTTTSLFFPEAKNFELIYRAESNDAYPKNSEGGSKWFTFVFQKNYATGKGIVPFGYRKYYNTNDYIQACNPNKDSEHALCALKIMENGWKVPKDYPFKF